MIRIGGVVGDEVEVVKELVGDGLGIHLHSKYHSQRNHAGK